MCSNYDVAKFCFEQRVSTFMCYRIRRATWNGMYVPLCLNQLVPLCPKAKFWKDFIYAQKGLKIAEILCSFCPKIIIFSLKPYCHKLAGTRTFLLLHTKGQKLQRKP